MNKPNLALIGFSTTGKSTVARLVAQALGWYYADTDQMIVATAGRPIHAIFSHEGEAAFRARETATLVAVLAGRHTVIATGGGIMTIAENRTRLHQRASLVCLTATPETMLVRLQEAGRTEPRPMLDAPDQLARIRSLLAQRQAVYAEADLTIPTDDRTPEQVAAEIVRWYEAGQG